MSRSRTPPSPPIQRKRHREFKPFVCVAGVYAREWLGLSARQVQDLAHVDRELGRLPRIEAAFVAGHITWTKARLLCRVATPEDEEPWLEVAQRLTARALARWGRARLLARQVAGEALSQAAAAEVIAAKVMSALGTDADPGLATPLHFPRAANGCAGPGSHADPILVGRESERSERIPPRAAGAPRASRRAEVSPHSPSANGCAPHAVCEPAGFPCAAAREPRLDRRDRARRAVAARAADRSGDLPWVQAHALVPIVELEHSQPWRAAWVAHAAEISVRRLEDDVERAIATGRLDPRSLSDPLSEEMQTGAHPTVPGETIHLFFTAPVEVARLFKAILATVQRRIERRNGRTASESEALDAMLEHCFETWALPNAKVPRDHRVFERDGWRCTVPGCSSYRNLHDHHIQFRSHGGPDDPWNRTALCAAHHQRAVHQGIRAHSHPRAVRPTGSASGCRS